ncbi:MAG: hypothetical protein ACU85V_00185 [Gammaproteobacteria bacterium]
MSVEGTLWAWGHANEIARPTSRLLLLAMGYRASPDAETWALVWCSRAEWQKLTGLDLKTISSALRDLQAASLIADTGIRTGATGQVVVWQCVDVPTFEDFRALKGVTRKKGKTEAFQKRKRSVSPAKGVRFSRETDPKTEHGYIQGNILDKTRVRELLADLQRGLAKGGDGDA